MPEFTKPTTITVVADEDWIIAVTISPSNIPFAGVFVSLYKIVSNLLPPTFLRLSPISDIPYKNSDTPQRSLNIDEISMSVLRIYMKFAQLRTV